MSDGSATPAGTPGATQMRVVKTRILVVDDDPALTGLVLDVLGAWGCEAAAAAGAGEAVGLHTLRAFDVVLSDIHMHAGNGFELLEEIRRGWPATPVILMSSFPTHDTVDQALAAGAFAFLSKPFSLDELREMLELLAIPIGLGRQGLGSAVPPDLRLALPHANRPRARADRIGWVPW